MTAYSRQRRFAAALGTLAPVLIAWVLIAPQISVIGDTAAVNPDAPLSSWMTIGTKDTLYECEEAKKRIVDQAQPPPGANDSVRAAIKVQKEAMKCVSDSTPGLPDH